VRTNLPVETLDDADTVRSYKSLARVGGADYQANANDEIVVMAMIETKEGIENLDAICATPGLDAVYIRPADL
jgi:2-keto-3-deoxy-L-rhamnonate aldolase RhmA